MDIPITFLDFETKENYLALQNKYSWRDARNAPGEPTYQKVVKKDFSIIYKTVNPITYEEDYKNISFHKDFLFPEIDKLGKGYINTFKVKLKEYLFVEDEKIKLFAEIKLKKLFTLQETINISDYLTKEVRVKLQTQIEIIIEYLKNAHILPKYSIDDKLKFNLKKIDVLFLFFLLRQAGKINSPDDSEFAFFLEKNFLYLNNITKKYTPIKKAYKVVHGVKRHSITTKKVIKILQKIFKNDDFYEVEV